MLRPSIFALLVVAGAARLAAAADITAPGDHATIQEAVSAANPGDTVLVSRGKYREHVVIVNKAGLTLRGIEKVVIDGGKFGVALFVESSPNCLIVGINVQRTGSHGIQVLTSDGAQVLRCKVTSAGRDGIRVDGSEAVTINDCTVTSVANDGVSFGVDGTPVVNSFINECTISKCGDDGIDVNGGVNVITGNRVSKTKEDGIELDSGGTGDGSIIEANTITKVKRYGILIGRQNHEVHANHVVKAGFDALDVNGSGHEVWGNTFTKPGGDGIWTDATGCNIHDNVIVRPKDDGIDLDDIASGNTLTANRVEKAGNMGFEVTGAPNTITGNNATGSKKQDLNDTSAGTNAYTGNTFPKSNLGP